MEVMMATTVAMRMTPGRENFCIRIVIAFICLGFFCVGFLVFISCELQLFTAIPVPRRNQEPSSQGALKKRPQFG
jgi:hypothetical protein